MATWVLSECTLKPLPKFYPHPRNAHPSKPTVPSSLRPFPTSKSTNPFGFREAKWSLNVSAPLRVPSVDGEDNGRVSTNGVRDGGGFDPGAPPPFNLGDIRAAIPKHCWVKDPWRSMSYVVRDVAVVFGMAAVAAYFNNWVVWPLYWVAQGTMFWALFVLGHDWYEWSYLRGGLTTIDRDYGWINNIHHDIGTHVIHHLFPQIPHYNLIEATEAAKPVLGKYYREPKKSGPLPLHLLGVLVRSFKQDHYVSDTGDVVYYQTDKELAGSAVPE
ncbi:hypothetical protein C1H46_038488 [Malus baccata]|uniref:Fatty acid desaturase N-terminal domain-containing protein n=1 Tax=Malus baccata TaxID=106549 RepID=A0A540KP64_MALBA|nr:hypothetical protein C1H46_038488 [Malus baccata]